MQIRRKQHTVVEDTNSCCNVRKLEMPLQLQSTKSSLNTFRQAFVTSLVRIGSLNPLLAAKAN